jgi:carbonic anhydrase
MNVMRWMKMRSRLALSLGVALTLASSACSNDSTSPLDPTTASASASATGGGGTGGAGGTQSTSTGAGGSVACGAAVDKPHDPTKAEWSYHEEADGPAKWGDLMGDATCGAGTAQTPIDIDDAATQPSDKALTFANYDHVIPIDLLDNGHTLQVNYASTMSAGDPQITYDGKTFYLLQFHWHSTSEHTMAGSPSLFEAHFVHKAADGALAVVGVLFHAGAENKVLHRLMVDDPGHEKESACSDGVKLDDLLPASRGFYHYSGSLTTPPCSEGLSWFVMSDSLEASTAQETAYQTGFSGTTNRPIQALNGRTVDKHAP